MTLPSRRFLSNLKMFWSLRLEILRKFFIKLKRFDIPPNQIISVIVYNMKNSDVTFSSETKVILCELLNSKPFIYKNTISGQF